MAVTNPDNVVTKQDLANFYAELLPYLGGNNPVLGTINRSDIYDTTEKVVGKWIDGRPIYQKVITADTPTVTTAGTLVASYVPIGASVKWVVDLQAYMNDATLTQFMQIPFIPGTQDKLSSNTFYQVSCRVNTNSASSNPNSIVINSNRTADNNKELTFVIRYTKTTDAANSYNYASENDYSTSEKIVGTWIDGSTLYQKTINFGSLPNNTEKSVAHGISGTFTIVDAQVIAINGTTQASVLTFYDGSTYCNFNRIGTNLKLKTNGNYSSFSAYVTIKYVKKQL